VSTQYPLVLNTGRIRDQWHTMTRTGRSPRLMGHNPEPFVLVHPLDATRFGVAAGDLVEVCSAVARAVVRADVADSVAPGHVFVPMHWSAQFASDARVGALIASAADPVSGQPELKHTAVSIRRYELSWHAFALSREPLAIDGCAYLARARGQGYWRYELAGERMPESWPEWADAVLGPRSERVELIDSAGRYRGARVTSERLQACVFVARSKALPSRSWLAGLFAENTLSDASRLAILSGRPSKPGLESGPIVCSCFSVGRSTLLRAIRTQELVSVDAIGKALRAGTNCGSCVPELKALVAEAAEVSATRAGS
jgi:assimilatory nitrate reductase catalytic subunit